jgi:hypothetical protein
MTPGPANLRSHNAVLGGLREGGFSIEMAIQRLLRPGRLHLRLRPPGEEPAVRRRRGQRSGGRGEGPAVRRARPLMAERQLVQGSRLARHPRASQRRRLRLDQERPGRLEVPHDLVGHRHRVPSAGGTLPTPRACRRSPPLSPRR